MTGRYQDRFGHVVDFKGDGYLDIFLTRHRGGVQNHWLQLTFTGLNDAELIGARVELLECGDLSPLSLSPDSASKSASTDRLGGSWPREIQSGDKSPHSKRQYRWIHAYHSCKSGSALEAHFGHGRGESRTTPRHRRAVL